MIHKSTHDGVEFLSEAADQTDLHKWYEKLPPSEVKASVVTIKCKEYRPYDQASFRIIVLCDHPFAFQDLRNQDANDSEDDAPNGPVLGTLVTSFTDWIERHEMPQEVLLGNRYTFVDWWPKEMRHHILSELSQSERTKWEMDNHFLACLELIQLSVISDQEFSRLWIGSNEPFFAAGRLMYGDLQWVRNVPMDLCRNEAYARSVLERVVEYSREYVGLTRLALQTDAESALLDCVESVLWRFKVEYVSKIPDWLKLAQKLLSDSNEALHPLEIANRSLYGEIDAACDRLRSNLVGATEGLENEIVLLINAILPTLEKPESSLLFSGDANR